MTIEEIQAAIIDNLNDIAFYIKLTEDYIKRSNSSTDPIITAMHELNLARAVGYEYIVNTLNIREEGDINEKFKKHN